MRFLKTILDEFRWKFPEIAVGSKWVPQDQPPWWPPQALPVTVEEVRDRWVRYVYKSGGVYTMEAPSFLYVFKIVDGQ